MEGISVVNPLMEIQRKLTKIKNLLIQEEDIENAILSLVEAP